jgi:asparagine synthase (glutamine-hydrolysing)
MCGIAAILRVSHSGASTQGHFEAIPESWLDALDDSIRHRGPDGQGRFRDRVIRSDGSVIDVAFVHRRLSIIDHMGGVQPMLNTSLHDGAGDGARSVAEQPLPSLFHGSPGASVHYRPVPPTPNLLAIVFNGCIYNHRALRRELQSAGFEFRTDHSDTEVLLHGWNHWGRAILDRLDGMYAFVLWDRCAETIILARDCWGEKPLYRMTAELPDGPLAIWASVPPESTRLSRLANMRMSPRRHPAYGSVTDWLRLGWFDTGPLEGCGNEYEGALQVCRPFDLAAGTAQGREQCFISHIPDLTDHPVHLSGVRASALPRDPASAQSRFDSLLDQAVRRRLEADVPLGILLSGGVDSSLLAHYACRAIGPLDTFTVRMPQEEYDESEFARMVATHLGTRHHTLDCAANPADDLVHLIETLGLPFADSSLLPTYWVCRAARSAVKVALAGDGGDELFLGYDRYFAPLRLHLPSAVGETLSRAFAWGADPKSRRARIARMLDAVGGDSYWDLLSIFSRSMLKRLIAPHSSAGPDLPFSSPRNVDEARWLDLRHYLPHDLLRKSDTASMAVALELRAPFLDVELSALAAATPAPILAPRNQRKWLLRQIARRYLPAHVVDRPKMGFAIPVGNWFRTNFGQMRTLLMDLVVHAPDPFPPDLLAVELNRRHIARLIDEHMRSLRDHSQRLYMLLVLAIWCRKMRRLI